MKLMLATKLISAILAVVIGTAAVGGGVTLAASDSLPGDPLYPVKLTVEDIRLNLASTPEAQVNLALQLVDERTAEAERLVEKGQPVPEGVVARIEQYIYRTMNQTAWASEEEMPGLLERIAQRTQAQAQVLEQVRTMAPEEARAGMQRAQQVCLQGCQTAMSALSDPQTFRWRYQHRDSMPEEITPPEPPTREPQEGMEEPHGPSGPDQDQMGTPQGDPQGDCDQEHNWQQDQEHDQQQDQERDQQHNQQHDQQQDRECDQECDQQHNQQHDQQQDRECDQQQGQQHEQQGEGPGNGNGRP